MGKLLSFPEEAALILLDHEALLLSLVTRDLLLAAVTRDVTSNRGDVMCNRGDVTRNSSDGTSNRGVATSNRALGSDGKCFLSNEPRINVTRGLFPGLGNSEMDNLQQIMHHNYLVSTCSCTWYKTGE